MEKSSTVVSKRLSETTKRCIHQVRRQEEIIAANDSAQKLVIDYALDRYSYDSTGRGTQHVILDNGQETTMRKVIEADPNPAMFQNSGEAFKAACRRSFHRLDHENAR